MKRNKIFLGVTASLLAVVGVVAAKQHKNPRTLFYTTLSTECAGTLNCHKVAPQNHYTAIPGVRLNATTANLISHPVCYTTVSQTGCFPAYLGE